MGYLESFIKSRNQYGFNPIWIESTQSLIWLDKAKNSICFHREGINWQKILPKKINAMFHIDDAKFLIILTHGAAILSMRDNEIIANPNQNFSKNPLSFAVIDPNGACIMTTIEGDAYLLRQNFITILDWRIENLTAMAFSPDAKQVFYTQLNNKNIMQADFNRESHEITNPQIFAKFRQKDGYPVALMANNDNLWVAKWQGWGITAYNYHAQILEDFALNTPHTTGMVAGGENFADLYITSAWDYQQIHDVNQEAGNIYKINNKIFKGMPAPKFIFNSPVQPIAFEDKFKISLNQNIRAVS